LREEDRFADFFAPVRLAAVFFAPVDFLLDFFELAFLVAGDFAIADVLSVPLLRARESHFPLTIENH
jgi:hypothetical protein